MLGAYRQPIAIYRHRAAEKIKVVADEEGSEFLFL
jgi:hypothetical protein